MIMQHVLDSFLQVGHIVGRIICRFVYNLHSRASSSSNTGPVFAQRVHFCSGQVNEFSNISDRL